MLEAGNGVALALAVGAVVLGSIPEDVLTSIRKWHGNIANLVNLVNEHQPQWMTPPDLLMQLTDNHSQLQTLINKCRTNAVSTDKPRFGNEPTFSMPLTTEDIAAALDRQHHEEFEAQMQEVERQRQEIERMQTELDAKK
jgi:hypothetical protein